LKIEFGYILFPENLSKKSMILIEPNERVLNSPYIDNLDRWLISGQSKIGKLKQLFSEEEIFEKLEEKIKSYRNIVDPRIISKTFFENS
jgi:hypothetical protein